MLLAPLKETAVRYKENPKEVTEMCRELEDWLHEEKNSGRAEGREEGKLETALELLKDGFPSEKVAKYTKLSKQAIENLARQHKLA